MFITKSVNLFGAKLKHLQEQFGSVFYNFKYKNEVNTTCVLYLLIIMSNFLYIFMKTCNFQFQSSILSNL